MPFSALQPTKTEPSRWRFATPAAVSSVEADFEGQAGEVDDYTYESAINAAFAGTEADADWLKERWEELVAAFASAISE